MLPFYRRPRLVVAFPLLIFLVWALNYAYEAFVPVPYVWKETPRVSILTRSDIGVIIKSGYSTKERLSGFVDGLDEEWNGDGFIVAADYSLPAEESLNVNGKSLPVVDVIAPLLEEKGFQTSPRLQTYIKLRDDITNGAYRKNATAGWELDILKHITGLQAGFEHMPNKKWYIMIDDDTYLLPTSLLALLSTIDDTIPQYLGSAIGKKSRFAHGGSGIVVSNPTLRKLFVEKPTKALSGIKESLTAKWGDALVSDTLRKIRVRIDEKYSVHFNGEPFISTRIRPDRICHPLIGFHHVNPEAMVEMRTRFADFKRPIRYGDLLSMIPSDLAFPFQSKQDWDIISADEKDKDVKIWKNSASADSCAATCQDRSARCLTWTYKSETRVCSIANWVTIGRSKPGLVSGMNNDREVEFLNSCNEIYQ